MIPLQDLFADSTFSKPYLMSYINCMFFIPCFVFAIVKRMRRGNATVQTILGRKSSVSHLPRNSHENQESLKSSDEDNPMMDDQSLSSSFLAASQFTDLMVKEDVNERPMTFRETWKLSLQISLLWVFIS